MVELTCFIFRPMTLSSTAKIIIMENQQKSAKIDRFFFRMEKSENFEIPEMSGKKSGNFKISFKKSSENSGNFTIKNLWEPCI